MIHNEDCHDCDHLTGTALTKTAFASKMADLETQAAATGEAAAQANFLYANGLYNMSYFGNGRAIFATSHENFDMALPRNREMSKPEKYYLRAAELSKNPEFKAKAIFMAAKAERNSHYDATIEHRGGYFANYFDPKSSYFAGKHFATLKQSYANTKYYQEILNECGYFKRYASGAASPTK